MSDPPRNDRDQGSLDETKGGPATTAPDAAVDKARRDIERAVYRRRSDDADIPAPKQQ